MRLEAAYDRSSVTTGVVHIGVGGFHRAHQAMFHDRLLRAGARDWGICGVGVLDADRRMADVMHAQRCLYMLVVKPPPASIGPSRDRLARRVPVRARRPRGGDRADRGRCHADRVADRHRGRLRRTTAPRSGTDPRRAAAPRDASAAWGRSRSCPATTCPATATRTRAIRPSLASATPASPTGSRTRSRFPNSMVDRITPRPPTRTARGPRALRRRRRLARGLRAVRAVGARGRLRGRAAALRGRRRAARRRRRALRADEAAAAQRQPPGARATSPTSAATGCVHDAAQDPLFRASCSATWTRRRPRRSRPCRASTCTATSATLIERFSNPQVRDTIARLCAEVRPDPEVAAAGDPRAARRRRRGRPRRRASSPAGRATPRASTNRARRSRSSTSSASA